MGHGARVAPATRPADTPTDAGPDGPPDPLAAVRERALVVRRLYAQLEQATHGRSWTREELLLGFVTDIGDLSRIALAREGVRTLDGDPGEALAHELADCLWCVLVLSDAYGVDPAGAFARAMDDLETVIRDRLGSGG